MFVHSPEQEMKAASMTATKDIGGEHRFAQSLPHLRAAAWQFLQSRSVSMALSH
jgi:hypothetical protein